ncbi:MAG: hypothetical protein NZM40_00575 [Sphingomonadaceae bacterium]|uniref:hypothetical protein n=1 Tax=Thermaurantiacus sp. TaxID=2820283 RepID=UPI00298EDDA4|nr:hypothetical protein [Thermaurantiacus sp.]MCS6985936.1 hypothetical protein [Sphingomonadaceae bacterium]MDW8414848.1 hypothetical protein [Thermaurantiacus sp.]
MDLPPTGGPAGLWSNVEEVEFAREAGREVPLVMVRVERDGAGWRALPVDPFGQPTGPARPVLVRHGAPVVGDAALRRARPFRCWAAIPRRDGSWWGARDLELHDQGGMTRLTTDETPPQAFELKMRNVVWPSGPNRPSLVLYVHEPGAPRALAYAWADPGAVRVGLNLRRVQASCTLAGAEGTPPP